MRTFVATLHVDLDDEDERTADDVRLIVWMAITRLSGSELHGALVSLPDVTEEPK